jgi:hypothetical protein
MSSAPKFLKTDDLQRLLDDRSPPLATRSQITVVGARPVV